MASILSNYTYPHSEIHIKDESIGNPIVTVDLPLHRPLIPIKAAKGKANYVWWYNGVEALDEFGDETFDIDSKYYRNEQLYLQRALFPNQGAFLVRLCDPAAKRATLVFEAHVTAEEITQYRRDGFGGIVVDENDQPIVLTDPGTGAIVTRPGYRIKHMVRPLDEASEKINTVLPKTVDIGGIITTIYPLVAFEYASQGSTGNGSCFRMWYDYMQQLDDIVEQNGCLVFNFQPLEQPYNSNTPIIVPDIYGTFGTSFTVKPGQKDAATNRAISVTEVLNNLYNEVTTVGDPKSMLPYSVHVYSDYFKAIGDSIIATEQSMDIRLVDGWMIDVLSCKDLDNNPYHTAIIDTTGQAMSSLHTYYLSNGDDGDTSDELFEEMWRNVLTMDAIPQLIETQMYPVTHLYDVGYTLDTKMAFAEFISKQDKCIAVMCTQDVSRDLNTMDESISTGSAVVTRMRITPESELYGTGALRAEIFGQSGYLTDRTVNNIVPATYWMMLKRASYQSGQSISNTCKGNPNNIVDIYRQASYVPYSPDQKQISWDQCVNYFQVKKMVNYFYPDVRTIYREQSSVLSDTTFTDACVYTKYIIDEVWSDYTGITVPLATLQRLVTDDIVNKCNLAYGKLYPDVTATMFQTDSDREAGDTFSIEVIMVGYSPFRKAKTTMIVRRENLDYTS